LLVLGFPVLAIYSIANGKLPGDFIMPDSKLNESNEPRRDKNLELKVTPPSGSEKEAPAQRPLPKLSHLNLSAQTVEAQKCYSQWLTCDIPEVGKKVSGQQNFKPVPPIDFYIREYEAQRMPTKVGPTPGSSSGTSSLVPSTISVGTKL